MGEWLRVVGELEALSAMATYAYERPADPFPELVEDGALFEADGLKHPLIPEATSVGNDLRLGGAGPRVVIVSGSNMSGKSTLLRSVGVNVVLAHAGAPVRAVRLRLSPLVLGATLHIEDSLQAGHSRFYAEILRIRAIVEAGRGTVPLLYLLDEILHGTNSFDRRIGAEGIVRALAGMGAIGLVTTHDLALAELPSTLKGAVNMHFEDRLGKRPDDLRLPDAPGRRRAQQRARAHAGYRTGRVSTKYEVRSLKYEVRSLKYEVRSRSGFRLANFVVMIEQPSRPDFPRPPDPIDKPAARYQAGSAARHSASDRGRRIFSRRIPR